MWGETIKIRRFSWLQGCGDSFAARINKLMVTLKKTIEMNQYIVSQWFKYKDDLKSFYENRFPDVDEMQELDFEEPLYVAEMGKEVLTNLLKYVINRGKDSIKLIHVA